MKDDYTTDSHTVLLNLGMKGVSYEVPVTNLEINVLERA